MNKKDKPVSILTGERIENRESCDENVALLDAEIKKLQKNKRDIKESQGLNTKKLIKQKRFFYKLYKTNWEVLSKLSNSTFKVLKFFEMHTDYMSNTVIVNNIHMTYKDMSKYCGVGERQFNNAVKELRKMNIILTERKGKYNIVTFNPLYIEDSLTEKEVYNKFDIPREV